MPEKPVAAVDHFRNVRRAAHFEPVSIRLDDVPFPRRIEERSRVHLVVWRYSYTSPCSWFVPFFVMYITCALEFRPYSALKLFVMTLTSLIAEKLRRAQRSARACHRHVVAVIPSTVMLFPRPRPPFELKLPDRGMDCSTKPGATPGAGQREQVRVSVYRYFLDGSPVTTSAIARSVYPAP
jgi:hypothetical protein